MAYGVRYRITGKVMQTNASLQLDICKKDYTGAISTVDGATDFVTLAWDPDLDTKYPIFKASSADIFFLSPARRYFLSLFTSNKFEYLVKYYESGTQVWSGYLLADLYNEPYEYKNHFVNLKAVDGLALLKNIGFKDSAGNNYTGYKSDLEIIQICIGKLNLNLPMYTAIDIYETTMDNGNSDDPLSQAYSPTEVFAGMDCATVLREILKPYAGQLWQKGNAWHIVRGSLLTGESYVRRYYNSSGTYVAWELHDPLQNLTSDDVSVSSRNILVQGATNMQVIPAIKEFTINQEFGLLDNALPGGDVEKQDFDFTFPLTYKSNYWEYYTTSTAHEDADGIVNLSDNSMALIMRCVYKDNFDVNDRRFYNNSLKLQGDENTGISIKFRYSIAWAYEGTNGFYVKAKIVKGNYIFCRTGWQLESSFATEEDKTFVLGGTTYANSNIDEDEIIVNEIPGDTTEEDLEIYIYQAYFPGVTLIPDPGVDYYLYVHQVIVKLGTSNDILQDQFQLTTEISSDNNYIPEPIDVLVADIPDITNTDKIYTNGKQLADGTPTKLWQVPGSEYQEQLIVALARVITDQYTQPTMIYDGLVEDCNLDIGTILQDPFDGIKLMVHQIAAYNPASKNMNVRLIELIQGDTLWTLAGTTLLTNTGEEILLKNNYIT